jgi:hypothetical protein
MRDDTNCPVYLRRRVFGRLRTAKTIESRLRRTLSPILHRCAAGICRRDIRASTMASINQRPDVDPRCRRASQRTDRRRARRA